jgi:hypothetical protein
LIEARVGVELQAREYRGDSLLELPAVAGVELVVQLVEPLALGAAVQTLLGQRLVCGQSVPLPREAVADQLRDRHRRQRADVLRQVREASTGPAPNRALIRFGLAAQQPQQRGFALTVAADQRHALAFIELQGNLIQQRPGPV